MIDFLSKASDKFLELFVVTPSDVAIDYLNLDGSSVVAQASQVATETAANITDPMLNTTTSSIIDVIAPVANTTANATASVAQQAVSENFLDQLASIMEPVTSYLPEQSTPVILAEVCLATLAGAYLLSKYYASDAAPIQKEIATVDAKEAAPKVIEPKAIEKTPLELAVEALDDAVLSPKLKRALIELSYEDMTDADGITAENFEANKLKFAKSLAKKDDTEVDFIVKYMQELTLTSKQTIVKGLKTSLMQEASVNEKLKF